MPDELYYYCDQSVFLSLLEKQQLWLTSLSQSNDHMEGRYGLREWLFRFGRDKEDRLRRIGAQSLIDGVLDDHFALGMCFSEEDDLLSQWRGYADDGAGYCVGFSRIALAKLTGSNVALSKVIYGHSNPRLLNDALNPLAEAFMPDAERYQGDPDGIITASLENSPGKLERQRRAVERLFTIKNEAFHEEKEWRMHLFQSAFEIKDLQFRSTRNGLSPYVKLSFPSSAITRVRTGPANQTPESVIKTFLRKTGFNVPLNASSATYRR